MVAICGYTTFYHPQLLVASTFSPPMVPCYVGKISTPMWETSSCQSKVMERLLRMVYLHKITN
jgi:hypothetical protein